MKKFAIVLLATMLVAGIAIAQKPALEKPVVPYTPNSRAVEVEPNDDYLTANALVIGDDMSAAIDPAGEVDFFSFVATAGQVVVFETHAGDIGDTKLYIFDVDGMTQLDYIDDGGVGYYSRLEFEFPADGTYFVEITGYSSTTQGTYILNATEGEPPCPTPENDTCEGALVLPMGTSFTTTTCGATNDYDPGSGGCTGFAAAGLDIVYYVDLVENQQFTVACQTDYDIAIYLITDCADPVGSCVAGADDTVSAGYEEIIFDAGDAPGRYYLILDAYSSTAFGDFEVTVDGVVATDATSFGTLKSMYR